MGSGTGEDQIYLLHVAQFHLKLCIRNSTPNSLSYDVIFDDINMGLLECSNISMQCRDILLGFNLAIAIHIGGQF